MTAPQTQLIKRFAEFRNDPYGFVLYSYPWKKKGTWLEDQEGPDVWQIKVMNTLKRELDKRDMSPAEVFASINIAVASGHGIGKTSLVAWLIHWFICCYPNPQIVVTAGTQAQLEKKTWRELAKWHKVSLQREWFEWTATKFYLKEAPDTWFASAIPWSEHNSDAFAGTHEKYVMVIFDEASTIADIIWEVVEGAMTTDRCIWIAFGNPVRNTGRFKACFGKYRKYWLNMRVDSRTAKMANQVQIERWRQQYGEDSDFFRKRVTGEFPIQASNQLISEAVVDACRTFTAYGYEQFPIFITCDVARFGDDRTVIMVNQGRYLHECFVLNHRDTVEIYTKIMECWNYWKEKNDRIGCFIDDVGVGGGVTDMLKRTNGVLCIGVNAGTAARDNEKFLNKRIEMWWNMGESLKLGYDLSGLSDEHFEALKQDLINIEYFMHPSSQKYQLEKVEDLKGRDLPSPDLATALALRFAYPMPNTARTDANRAKKAENSGSKTLKRKAQKWQNGKSGSRSSGQVLLFPDVQRARSTRPPNSQVFLQGKVRYIQSWASVKEGSFAGLSPRSGAAPVSSLPPSTASPPGTPWPISTRDISNGRTSRSLPYTSHPNSVIAA